MTVLEPIAHIKTDFDEKFGIPRQSGLIVNAPGEIVFEPEYRDNAAVRGLEEHSHIWLIWEFSENTREKWSPTVRPPRLGGNVRMGVFATRSPFRPNPLGLSSVRLERVELTADRGPVLRVRGADLMNGTPIFDIKPYVPYVDSHPEATGGFAPAAPEEKLKVEYSCAVPQYFTPERLETLTHALSFDPRPSYQDDALRVYGLAFAGHNVRFCVENGVVRVTEILPAPEKQA